MFRCIIGPGAGIAVMAVTLGLQHNTIATGAEQQRTRPPLLAGRWYPADSGELAEQIDAWLTTEESPRRRPIALIAPHAGYRFSGSVAGAAFSRLRGFSYKRVIVLGFSHRRAASYSGIDVPMDLSAYATPLGQVAVDVEACQILHRDSPFSSTPGMGADEHSIELQLPFLQRVIGDFQLVPLLVGRLSDSECARAASLIIPLIDEGTLLVASSDFTHYGPNYTFQPFKENVQPNLASLADQVAASISACDYDGFVRHCQKTQDTICGRGPIRLLLRILSAQGGATGHRLAVNMSGAITNDWSNSVTYQSFEFTSPCHSLSEKDRSDLLSIARRTITDYLHGASVTPPESSGLSDRVQADGACFVTLQNNRQLRGCIGNMEAVGPLYESVVRNAVSACQDRRFISNPVTADELDQLHIEISYLTPMKVISNVDEIIVGRHGLLISQGFYRGVLLPQVAYERGWTREEFLSQTCRKAGLPPDAWRQPQTKIELFEAEVFGESQ